MYPEGYVALNEEDRGARCAHGDPGVPSCLKEGI